MGKKKFLSAALIEMFRMDPVENAYLEYNDKVGGDYMRLVPGRGYPRGTQEMGGPIAVYEECIRRGVTWEELLNYVNPCLAEPDLIL